MAKRLTQCLILFLLAFGLLGPSVLGGQPQRVGAATGETAPVFQANGPQTVNSPSANYVLSLDGTSSYVTVPYDAALNPTGAFTLEASAVGYESASDNVTVEGRNEAIIMELQPSETPRTDINADSQVNAVDIQLVINAALGMDIGEANGDVNGDGQVNAVDVQVVINAALGIIS